MGPVWSSLLQTAQAAECAGCVAALEFVNAPAVGYGDCRNVVLDALRPAAEQLNPRKRYAGVLRAALSLQGRQLVRDVVWTRDHAREKLSSSAIAALSPQLRWEAGMNERADDAADWGRGRPPSAAASVRDPVDFLVGELRGLYRYAAGVLRLWPRLPGNLTRLPAGPTAAPRARKVVQRPH